MGHRLLAAFLPVHQDQHLDHRESEILGRGHGTRVYLALMLSMPEGSWWRLGLWLPLRLAVYFVYAWRSGRFGTAVEE